MKTSFKESGVRGQTVHVATGKDDSSYPVNDAEARNGKAMGGGVDNIAHSLTGASAVQHVKGKK